jgi:hypothetical protein
MQPGLGKFNQIAVCFNQSGDSTQISFQKESENVKAFALFLFLALPIFGIEQECIESLIPILIFFSCCMWCSLISRSIFN